MKWAQRAAFLCMVVSLVSAHSRTPVQAETNFCYWIDGEGCESNAAGCLGSVGQCPASDACLDAMAFCGFDHEFFFCQDGQEDSTEFLCRWCSTCGGK